MSRTLKAWHHADTDKAILVSLSPITPRKHEEIWLPKSQVKITARENVENPGFGTEPHIAQYRGTLLTLELPDWLVEKNPRLEGELTP
jgi:hypothetical protein